MQIFLDKVLDIQSIETITEQLKDDSLLQDGKKTAGRTAKKVKHNLQAINSLPKVREAAALVEKSLMAHPVFLAAAQPLKLAKILFSVYQPGMSYGSHIDDPFIAGTRTDLSFTLFLNEPSSYEGGDLVLQKHDGDEAIKLAAGNMVLYPSSSVHCVEPVKQGTRIVAVGWLQSRIRLGEHRETLFDLQNTLSMLPETETNAEIRLNLLKIQANLLRLWSE